MNVANSMQLLQHTIAEKVWPHSQKREQLTSRTVNQFLLLHVLYTQPHSRSYLLSSWRLINLRIELVFVFMFLYFVFCLILVEASRGRTKIRGRTRISGNPPTHYCLLITDRKIINLDSREIVDFLAEHDRPWHADKVGTGKISEGGFSTCFGLINGKVSILAL